MDQINRKDRIETLVPEIQLKTTINAEKNASGDGEDKPEGS